VAHRLLFQLSMKRLTLALLFLSSLPGCSERTEAAVPQGTVVESSGGAVLPRIAPSGAYRPMTLSAMGSVGGTISLQGVVADSTVVAHVRANSCADTTAREADVNQGSVGDVLVWIEGIDAGKPLPELRRETLVIEQCRFVPRVMTVVSGTTINVMSQDRIAHTSRFYRMNANEPAEEIRTVDAGQVVPSEKIAKEPGIVEARDVRFPGMRAYIAVFNHPYHAVTDDRGVFQIDSLPPGTYTLKVWHERMPQPAEERVVVSSGGVGRLGLTLTLK
jgi:hypothetical protein